MLKQTLQAPPENGAIAGYTSELSCSLRNGVPGERADEIVQEAHAHLLDRADAIAEAENLSQAEAEARAVAAFTPAVAFAREMAQSAYETGHSKAWRTMGAVSTAVVSCVLLALLVLADNFNAPMTFYSPFTPISFTVLLAFVGLCAFQARQAQTRRYATWGAIIVIFTFFYTGFFYLDGAPGEEVWTQGNRTGLARAYQYFRTDNLRCESDIARLQAGLQTFRSSNTVVPAELKGSGGSGYVVPFSYGSTRKGQPVDPFALGTQTTVATLAEAQTRWWTDGPLWLAHIKQTKSVDEHYEEPLRVALQQKGFARTAWWYAMTTASLAAYLVLVDWLFAKMGRAAFAKRRKTKRA